MEKYPELMIDLETMGLRPGCVLLSLGACFFDPARKEGEQLGPQFYVVFNRQQQEVGGNYMPRHILSSTKEWWDRQSPEARKIFDEPQTEVSSALIEFNAFVSMAGGEKVRVWGNGADFDNVLLDDLYEWCEMVRPWGTYNSRCFRTLKENHRAEYERAVKRIPRGGTHHNALDDAVWQAQIASRIMLRQQQAASVLEKIRYITDPDGKLPAPIGAGPELEELQAALDDFLHQAY